MGVLQTDTTTTILTRLAQRCSDWWSRDGNREKAGCNTDTEFGHCNGRGAVRRYSDSSAWSGRRFVREPASRNDRRPGGRTVVYFNSHIIPEIIETSAIIRIGTVNSAISIQANYAWNCIRVVRSCGWNVPVPVKRSCACVLNKKRPGPCFGHIYSQMVYVAQVIWVINQCC